MAAKVPAYSWVVLFLLLMTYVMNQWDRYLLNYLYGVALSECPSAKGETCNVPSGQQEQVCGDMGELTNSTVSAICGSSGVNWANCNACLQCIVDNEYTDISMKYGACITNDNYGVLVSFGFVALFSFTSLFAGRAADLFNRRNIVGAALILWSACTLGQGLGGTYTEILGARLGLGMFQAFMIPPTYSLIADYFPKDMLATANGIYSFGVYVGGGLSSLSIVLAKATGWRETTFLCAGIGAVVGVFFFVVVREPRRGAMAMANAEDDFEDREDSSVNDTGGKELEYPDDDNDDVEEQIKTVTTLESFKIVLSDKCTMLLIVAAALRFIGGFGIGGYLPLFFSRQYPDYNDEYSYLNAGVVSFGGALSSFLGGFLADRWTKTQPKAKAWIPAIGCILGYPLMIGVLYSGDFYASIVCLFFEYLVAECWFGPALSIIQVRIPNESRGIAIALYLFIGQMIGNCAPLIMGKIDDSSTATVQKMLAIVVGMSYIGCALVFLLVGRLMSTPSAAEKGTALLSDAGKV